MKPAPPVIKIFLFLIILNFFFQGPDNMEDIVICSLSKRKDKTMLICPQTIGKQAWNIYLYFWRNNLDTNALGTQVCANTRNFKFIN